MFMIQDESGFVVASIHLFPVNVFRFTVVLPKDALIHFE